MAPSDQSLAVASVDRQGSAPLAPPHARHSPGRSKRVRIQAFREVPINTLKLQRLSSGRVSPLKLPPPAILPLPSSQNPQATVGPRPSPRGPPTTSLLSSILGTNPLPLSRPQPAPQAPLPALLSSTQPSPSAAATLTAPAPTPNPTPASFSTSEATPATTSATTSATTTATVPSPPSPTPADPPSSTTTDAPSGPAPLSFWSLRRPAVNPRMVELLMTCEVLCLPPDLVSRDLPSCSEMAALAKLDCDMEALLAECSC